MTQPITNSSPLETQLQSFRNILSNAPDMVGNDARRMCLEMAKELKVAHEAGIEEAALYHDELACFFTSEAKIWELQGLPGCAEREMAHANRHRVYAREIRERIWRESNPVATNQPTEGKQK